MGRGFDQAMVSAKQRKENEQRIQQAIAILQQVADNTVTPRNIRKTVKEAIAMLQNESLSMAVRAADVISMLEEVSQDPNMPSFSRVTIWSAVSQLEGIRE